MRSGHVQLIRSLQLPTRTARKGNRQIAPRRSDIDVLLAPVSGDALVEKALGPRKNAITPAPPLRPIFSGPMRPFAEITIRVAERWCEPQPAAIISRAPSAIVQRTGGNLAYLGRTRLARNGSVLCGETGRG